MPPTASLDQAAALLSREQVRRLPVVEGRRLVGMVTLSDLSRQAPAQDTADVLREITANIKRL